MKKIIAMTLAATCTLAASAIDVKLFHGDKLLQSGSEYKVGYVQTAVVPGLPMYRTVWNSDLFIQADPGLEIKVTMSSELAGAQFCGIDGQCIYTAKADEMIVKTGSTKSTSPEDLQIEYIVSPGQALPTETNSVFVEVSNPTKPTDNVWVIVNFVPMSQEELDAGVENLTIDSNAPVKYFDLHGIEIPANDLVPGNVYLRRQGANTRKVLVK